MIGRTISHYKILEELGRGGMGVVYKAQDTKLDRVVVLKFLPPELTRDAGAKARFVQEARAAAALNHPHIVTIYEIGDHEGQTFISMEYVEGESLRGLIEQCPLSLDRTLDLALQVADGLGKAHQADIVHRDIKPDNLLVDSDGRVRILDFGLAKLRGVTKLTTEASTLGTIQYMSPEQARGEDVDHRTDIWSLGAVLYEMITGMRPFKGDYEQAIIYSILNEDPEPPTALRTGIPMELERIILKCLRKDPKDRYQGVGDLITDLRQIRGAPVSATSVPAATGRGWTRWSWLGVVVVLAALAAVFLPPYLKSPETSSTDDRKMLVVLPFENLGTPDDEYFANGITDAITARLAGLQGLGVISRQSAMQYKNTAKNIRQIGEDLGVDFVLEGTVQRERPGDPASRVRVIPQLIRVSDDIHLWASTYDEDLTEVFRVQSDIAEQVAIELDVTLLEPERRALESRPTDNLQAYEYYLQGNEYSLRRLDLEDARTALQMYEEAVALDPGFAEAWAGLSRALVWLFRMGDRRDALPEAESAANEALRLNRDLPETQIAVGYLYYYGHHDLNTALRHFTSAQARRPSDVEATEAIAYILRRQGQWDRALRQLQHAARLDPAKNVIYDELSYTCYFMRKYSESLRYVERSIELIPDLAGPYFQKMLIHVARNGDIEEAEQTLAEALGRVAAEDFMNYVVATGFAPESRILPAVRTYILNSASLEIMENVTDADTAYFWMSRGSALHYSGQEQQALLFFDSARVILEREIEHLRGPMESTAYYSYVASALAETYAALGRKEEAIRLAKEAVDHLPASRDAVDGAEFVRLLAETYATVGEPDKAIDQLEYLLSVPSSVSVSLLNVDPVWDPLRGNPRFERLIQN